MRKSDQWKNDMRCTLTSPCVHKATFLMLHDYGKKCSARMFITVPGNEHSHT
jgi:hypothetical protein